MNQVLMDRVRDFIESDPCNVWTNPTEAIRGMVNTYLEQHRQMHAIERMKAAGDAAAARAAIEHGAAEHDRKKARR